MRNGEKLEISEFIEKVLEAIFCFIRKCKQPW